MAFKNCFPLPAIAILVAIVACSDQRPEPDLLAPATPSLADRLGQEVRAIPAVLVDVPEARPPWDTSDAAFVQQLEKGDGLAIIAFKDIGGLRLGSNPETRVAFGREYRSQLRAPVSAAAIRAGLDLMESRGVEFMQYLSALGAAIVRLEPNLALELRDKPLIDYVTPEYRFELARFPGAHASALPSETTDWGIYHVNANLAWYDETGQGAEILIIVSRFRPFRTNREFMRVTPWPRLRRPPEAAFG